MVLFSTKFAVSDDFSRTEFFELLQKWISSLPECSMELSYQGESEYELSSDQDKYKIVIYSSDDCLAVQFLSQDDVALHTSTYVLRKIDGASVMFIRLEKSLFEPSFDINLSYESPLVMRELFWREYGGMDHGLLTDDKPFLVRKNDVGFMIDILSSNIKFFNPIVYVTVSGDTSYQLDIQALAVRLTGIAHVVADANPYVASLLCNGSESRKDMEQGTIRVLFPNGEQKDFQNDANHDFSGDSDSNSILDTIVLYIYQAMANVIVDDDFSFQKIRMSHLLSNLQSDQEVSAICDELLAQKDSEIKDLQSQVASLKKDLDTANRKSASIQELLRKKTEKSGKSEDVISLDFNKEKDYYPGERKDVILKLIQREVNQMTGDNKLSKSRKFDILSDIIASNEQTGSDEAVMKTFKQIVESGTFNRGDRGELERLGFVITKSGGSHYNLAYNGDARYQFTVASTPSDCRAGENLAASYMNMVFGY